MAGNSLQALQSASLVAVVGVVIGLLSWPFEPRSANVWIADFPKYVIVFLVPAVGLAVSLLLAGCVQCDPLIVDHSPSSRAAVAGAIVLPTLTALLLHLIVLWAGLAGHSLGTMPLVFVAGLLIMAMGGLFYSIEQNYVVGIRDQWTLRSPQVWEKTHAWAYKFYFVAGIVLLVLTFIVPSGFWALITILCGFLIPTFIAVIYSYFIRDEQYSYIVR